MDEIIAAAREEMVKAVGVIRQDLSTVRTGRAGPQLVESLLVEAYGTKMRLIDLASIAVPDPQTLIVTPFDQTNAVMILKAIEEAQMGLTPVINDNVIRVMVPPLSQERREELVKLIRTKLESGRVIVRQIRHKHLDALKKAAVDEDTEKRLEKELQKLTDETMAEIDLLGERKEKELLTV